MVKRIERIGKRGWTSMVAGLLTVLIAGCPGAVGDGGGGGGGGGGDDGGPVEDGNRDSSLTSPLGKTFGEPNDGFAEPVVAVLDAGDVARLQGTVSVEGDIDVYLIGSLDPGDRVIADLRATDAVTPLDATLALFDDDGRLVFDNDDRRSTSPIDLDPYIDWRARHAGASYKLIVSHSGLAASDGFTGAYTADVTIERGGITPAPVAQSVLLDFSGGEVTVAGDGPMVLAPFDAGAISPIYDGQTDALKTKIRDVFVEKYARFDVTVLTSDDPPPATGTTFTTVHFGGFNDGAYGIADDVDLLNLNRCDDAVIFTETFFPQQFASLPTVDGMGVAIGNVAAHECGHLLGLNHVNDDTDLMDAVSPPDALLLQQEFADSPLSEQIVPIGTQDSALLLFEAVGEAP